MSSPPVEDRHLAQEHLRALGLRLAAIRAVQGWTQQSYAEHLGLAQSSAGRVENGENHRLGPLVRYAEGLGYDLALVLTPTPVPE